VNDYEKASKLTFGWIDKGDVLLAHNATVGRTAHYDGSFSKALIGTSLTCFCASCGVLDSWFLFAQLRSRFFQAQLEKEMAQTTRNQVPITAQRRLKVVIPPLEQQLLFSTAAQGSRAALRKLAQARTMQDQLFDSLVQRAFRGEL
jgi:type I restriction enzyme S subunit